MKIRDILVLAQALQALDGYMKIVKDGGTDKAVQVPYEFSANVRFVLAKNINSISAVSRDFTTARDALVRQFSDNGKIPDSAMDAFDAAATEILDRDEEVKLSLLSQKDLKLDRNPVPPSVLARLMPIFEEEEEDEAS